MRAIRFSLIEATLLSLSLFFAPLAQSQPNREYPETGTVRFLVFSMGTFKNTQYVITTNRAIYHAQCTHFRSDNSQEPDCSFDHKTIVDGTAVNFRVDGDTLLLPTSDHGSEQQLLIDRKELNPYPQTPTRGMNDVSNGVIVAVGSYKNEQYMHSLMYDRCASRPSQGTQPSNPKTPPPASAAGKSSSSNLQFFGASMTPSQSDDLFCMSSKARPLDSFKLITSDRVYEVACAQEGPCQVNGQILRLGAKYFVRVDFPKMWIATDPAQFGEKSDYRVLSGLRYPENH